MSRTPFVVVPLLVLLALTAVTGARMFLAEPEPADAAAGATCWHGRPAESVDTCSRPFGEAGLAWVFPSLEPHTCRDIRPDDRRRGPEKLTCREKLRGTPVTIRYGGVGTTKGGRSYFDKTYAKGARAEQRGPDGSVNRYVWRQRKPTADGTWMLTSMYRQHPYFVTVEAPSAKVRDQAFKRLVEMRDAADVRGVGGE